MVDTCAILLNKLFKKYNIQEVYLTAEEMKENVEPLIAHHYEDGRETIRTQEFNKGCEDKW